MSGLEARPHAPRASLAPGVHPLGLASPRDGLLVVPPPSDGAPLPLIVGLHGAGGEASQTVALFGPVAVERGFVLLAPDSRGRTWDVMMRRPIGPDVAFLDQALDHLFDRVRINPDRIVVAGFSDGASYALTLGLANGDLFRRIVALSPGYAAPPRHVGLPEVFVSHGTDDDVLPVDRCSRHLVPLLRQGGYPVVYREFEGGHVIPPEIGAEAVEWALRA
jgi:phospholipase/carboxylesterase